MHGHALTLPPQNDRLVRLDDPWPSRGEAEYEFGSGRELNLRAAWATAVRYRWMMLAILCAALGAGLASIWLTSPTYRAEAKVQIDPAGPRVTGSEDVVPAAGKTENDRVLQTQVDLIGSRSTAQQVARKLELAGNPAFLRAAGITAAPGVQRDAQVTDALARSLTVSSPRDTRMIVLGVTSHDPVLAARAANAFADTVIGDSLQRKVDTYSYSRGFLQKQLGAAKQRLERSERALVDYARSAGLVDAGNAAGVAGSGTERRSIVAASLVDLNASLSQAQANRFAAQQRWREAQATPLTSLPEVLANPAVQELTRRRAELDATLEQERQRRQDAHPAIVQAKAQIGELDRQIAGIAAGVRNAIGNQYRVAAGQEAALRSRVNGLKAATFAEQGSSVRYRILEREADADRNLYHALLQRFQQVNTDAANTTTNVSIVDRAAVPAVPAAPRPAVNMAIAALVGIVLALLAAFTRRRLDTRVHGPTDVEQELPVPLLGVVPALRHGESLVDALDNPHSPVTEAHHAICLALEPVSRSEDHCVVLLTSSSPHEGKSTTALKLAAQCAASDRKVLVIDGDMRRGALHRTVGLPNRRGLADLLASDRDTSFDRSVQFCEKLRLFVLTRGRGTANPAELLASGRFAALLTEALARFDVVIIDGPPVLGLADAPRMSGMADATVFVVEANRTPVEQARTALRRLCEAGGRQVGVVLTKYRPEQDINRAASHYEYDYDYSFSADDDDVDDVEDMAEQRRDPQLQPAV